MTKFGQYQSVCNWKCKLCDLLKDFTSCVTFLSVCKPQVANILTSKIITTISRQMAIQSKRYTYKPKKISHQDSCPPHKMLLLYSKNKSFFCNTLSSAFTAATGQVVRASN